MRARSRVEIGDCLLALRVVGAPRDLGVEGRLAYFVMQVEDVQEDSADYATLTSGVTFRLKQPDQVVPRWQRTVDALRAAVA